MDLRRRHPGGSCDFNAVMFVDVGPASIDGNPEYLTWQELADDQESGRWQLQLHCGLTAIGRSSTALARRLRPLLRLRGAERGLRRMAEAGSLRHQLGPEHARRPHPQPTARSPSLPRTATTASKAPTTHASPTICSAGSTERYGTVFTQDRNARAQPGIAQPLGRSCSRAVHHRRGAPRQTPVGTPQAGLVVPGGGGRRRARRHGRSRRRSLGKLGSHERKPRAVGNHHERRRHLRPDPPHGLLRHCAPLGSGRAGRLLEAVAAVRLPEHGCVAPAVGRDPAGRLPAPPQRTALRGA